MTKRWTVIVRYSDCCKRTIIEEIEKRLKKRNFTLEIWIFAKTDNIRTLDALNKKCYKLLKQLRKNLLKS